MRRTWLVGVLMLLVPAAGNAQVAWDSPLLLPPRAEPGFGIFLADMAGGGLGVIGTWRSTEWNYGVRAGISEDAPGDGIAIFGGVDYSGMVNRATAEFPIDIDWVLGAGASVGDGVLLSAPIGLTGAHTFVGEGARFTPYLTPRIVLDGWLGNDDRKSNLNLTFAVDVGLDVRLTGSAGPLSGMTIRFGGSIGDREALALGLVF